MGIGHTTWVYLGDKEDFLDPRTKNILFSGIKDFYIAVASTIMKKFSFSDSVLDDVAFLMPVNQASMPWMLMLSLKWRNISPLLLKKRYWTTSWGHLLQCYLFRKKVKSLQNYIIIGKRLER